MGTYRGGYVWRGSLDLVKRNAAILAERVTETMARPGCGTGAGLYAHERYGERPCEACRRYAREERARYSRAADRRRYWDRKAATGAAQSKEAV